MTQKAITISMLKNRTEGQTLCAKDGEQRMTSLEIAELTGKPHNDVLKAIRKMEDGWRKVCQGNFSLTSRTIVQQEVTLSSLLQTCYIVVS